MAKLDESLVLEVLRRCDGSPRGIGKRVAAELNISPSTVSLIRRRKIWKHVTFEREPRTRGGAEVADQIRRAGRRAVED